MNIIKITDIKDPYMYDQTSRALRRGDYLEIDNTLLALVRRSSCEGCYFGDVDCGQICCGDYSWVPVDKLIGE